MKIGLVAPVKPSHPYLENDPAPLFDLHYRRLAPWLWFRASDNARTAGFKLRRGDLAQLHRPQFHDPLSILAAPRLMVLQVGRSTSTGKSSEARSANGLKWSRVSSQARIKIPCPAQPAALTTIPRWQPLAAQPLDREAAPPPHWLNRR